MVARKSVAARLMYTGVLFPTQWLTMSATVIHTDVIIIGGGIAGLWLLNRLNNAGYSAVLFEQGALGSGQTIASQGMIHGGIKYALGGALTGSSEAIASMPEHWRRCLRGEGDVDLRDTPVLSDHFYLWSTGGIGSRLTSFLASKASRGRVDSLSREHYPPQFQHPSFRGQVYKLVDLVLDVPALVNKLYQNYRDRVFQIHWPQAHWQRTGDQITGLSLEHDGQPYEFTCQTAVLTAGEGNEALCRDLGIDNTPMQRRPLQQVLVKHDYPQPLYAHCTGNNPSPRLTISSHPCRDGRWVWYLGGDLATEGTHLAADDLIAKARQELTDLFPWLNFSQAEWATLYLNRAEPKQKGLLKPENAFAKTADRLKNVIVAWPTKLTLAPNLADEVLNLLPQVGTRPADFAQAQALPRPKVGTPCWETLFASRQDKHHG